MNNEVSILKWAAGLKSKIPDDIKFDVPALLDLIKAHNLSERILHRINKSTPPWVHSEFLDGLYELQLANRQKINSNIIALRELRDELTEHTHALMIKGFSTYILCNQEETLRGGDIDLLSNNPDEVISKLISLGYSQTRMPFLHELGEYTRESIEFDIHDNFPVNYYSDNLLQADLVPSSNPDAWVQNYQFLHKEIRFSNLAENACYGRNDRTSHVMVTDPNYLAIVLCAHAFMNYVNMWSISHREKTYIRLSEIADLFVLSKHPLFQKEKFLSYVKYYRANDAVEWAASIATRLLGENPLPVTFTLNDHSFSQRFPRCLWWNFWAALPLDLENALQTNWLSMNWLTKHVGANLCSIKDEAVHTYSTVETKSASKITRYITQSSVPFPIVLMISRSETGITVNLQVQILSGCQTERVRIDVGHQACELIYSIKDNRNVIVGAAMIRSFTQRDTYYELTFDISWETVKLINAPSNAFSFFLGVAHQSSSNEVISSLLVPLEIEY